MAGLGWSSGNVGLFDYWKSKRQFIKKLRVDFTEAGITFDDVVGVEEAKEELQEIV